MHSKIMIGTPLAVGYKVDWRMARYCYLEMGRNKNCRWNTEASHYIEYNRNKIVDDLLRSDFTHLFFLDADTVPPDGTINRLLKHDKDIVSGKELYQQDGRWIWNYQLLTEGEDLSKNPFVKVEGASTSVILIKRRVFEAMEWPWYEMQYMREGRYIGDDFYFCYKAAKLGFDTWVDLSIECIHRHIVDLTSKMATEGIRILGQNKGIGNA